MLSRAGFFQNRERGRGSVQGGSDQARAFGPKSRTVQPTSILGTRPGEEPRDFEWRQNMRDKPLETHPETGEPVHRIVPGGLGILREAEA